MGGTSNASPAAIQCTFHNWYCMKFKSLLLFLLLLLVFCGYAYAETKPRKFGLYFRNGVSKDVSRITDDDETYAESTEGIGSEPQMIPIALQLDEDLLSNWAYTTWFVSLESVNVEDMPPVLPNTTYEDLIDFNKSDNGTKDFSITSAQTNIDVFKLRHPEYTSQIDALSDPSLSGDLNLWTLVVGKSLGVFVPIGERHRLASLGVGLGVSYTEGQYAVNLCDPYFVEGEPSGSGFNGSKTRRGICKNKSEIYVGQVSNFGYAYNLEVYGYSYIGESFELNILKFINYESTPITSKQATLYPRPNASYRELFSLVYAL
jgi:hypothetical protein